MMSDNICYTFVQETKYIHATIKVVSIAHFLGSVFARRKSIKTRTKNYRPLRCVDTANKILYSESTGALQGLRLLDRKSVV